MILLPSTPVNYTQIHTHTHRERENNYVSLHLYRVLKCPFTCRLLLLLLLLLLVADNQMPFAIYKTTAEIARKIILSRVRKFQGTFTVNGLMTRAMMSFLCRKLTFILSTIKINTKLPFRVVNSNRYLTDTNISQYFPEKQLNY